MPTTPLRRAQIGILLAATIGNFVSVTPAVQTVFGLFLVPISREFHWPRAHVSGVLTLLAVVSAIAYPIIGRLIDRFGARRLLLVGNLAFALSIVALSAANGDLIQFYVLFGILGIVSAIPSGVMFTKVVTGWFDAGRGRALGLTGGLGNGAGATVMPIIAGLVMVNFGWRAAYQGIGLIVAALGFPVLFLFLRDPPRAEVHGERTAADGGRTLAQAARTATFWIMLTAIALGAGCMTAVFAHVTPILTDRGVALETTTLVVSVFALVTAAWQIAMGALLDRTSAPIVATPFYIVAAGGVLLLQRAASLPMMLAAGALMGVGLGTEFGALPYFISRYFGLRSYGAISGVMYSVVMLMQGVTPYLMDAVFDARGLYDTALYAIEAALVCGALLLTMLPAYGRGSGAQVAVTQASPR